MEHQAAAKTQRNATRVNHVQRQSIGPLLTADSMAGVQSSIGNYAVQRLISSPYIQAKLQVSTPGDPYEQEADRVADTVMRMPDPEVSAESAPHIQAKPLSSQITRLVQHEAQQIPLAVRDDEQEEKVAPKLDSNSDNYIQRTCAGCADELSQTTPLAGRSKNDGAAQVQRKGDHAVPARLSPPASANLRPLQGGGSALPAVTRAFFEPRFGTNLSGVRIHTGAEAATSARALRARAYTFGQDIVFGAGEFEPSTARGKHLVAHELTHVVQQSRLSTPPDVVRRSPDSTGDIHQNLEDQFTREHGVPPLGGAHGADYATWLAQTDYDAAVALLQSRDPTMYGYLRQGRIGRTVRVKTLTVPVTGSGPNQPTSFEFRFDLLVRQGGVHAGALAQFETQQPNLQMTVPTATATLLMPMNFTSPDGPNAALRLAEFLYHEGIHMLLAMDRVIEDYIPGSSQLQSGKRAAVEAYRAQVQSNRAFQVLAADLEIVIGAFMTQHHQPQQPGYYRNAAQRVINGVIDERFAVDQQRQHFAGNAVANSTIASAYIPSELENEGIILANTTDRARLIQEMTAVLNLIPAGGSSPAVRPSPSPNPPAPNPPTHP